MSMFKGNPRPSAELEPVREQSHKVMEILEATKTMVPGQSFEIDLKKVKFSNFSGKFYKIRKSYPVLADFGITKTKDGGYALKRYEPGQAPKRGTKRLARVS